MNDSRHPVDFASTHWSVVQAAGGEDQQAAQAALEVLCQSYWLPVYTFIRRQGHSHSVAQDHTQEFFSLVLARNDLANVSPEKGRFRSFLAAAVKNYLRNAWDKTQAAKRGGGRTHLSLDFADAEQKYLANHHHDADPHGAFKRQWALTLLTKAQKQLRQQYAELHKLDVYEALQPFLTGEHAESQREVGQRLGLSPAATKSAVFRMKSKLGQCLRDQVRQTVEHDDQVPEEIAELFEALR